jgi:HAD superfamily hydrolase (TIGR01509 family)
MWDSGIMTKAIIFDVDGTLAETEEIHRRAFNRAFRDEGFPWHWDRATYRQLLQVTGGKERIRHFVEQNDSEYQHIEDLDHCIRRIHQRKTKIYTDMVANGEAEFRPGVRQLISRANENDIRLAIATTTSPPNIDALLRSAYGDEGANIFEVICAGDSVVNKKPAPDIYIRALSLLNLSAKDCLAIEDSRNGLLAAHGAGIPTVVTPSRYTDDQDFDEALFVAKDLNGIRFAEIIAARCRMQPGGLRGS